MLYVEAAGNPDGLFRQSLNGTGTGNGTGTIGFIEYYARNSHYNGNGTGTGNLTIGFQTHFLELTWSPLGALQLVSFILAGLFTMFCILC